MKDAVFHDNIKTTVPTHNLIEDYRLLEQAVRTENWSLVNTVMDCLADSISLHTDVPYYLAITPSPSSHIEPEEEPGILLVNMRDPNCLAGHPVSFALDGGCLQCPETCPYMTAGKCRPTQGDIPLKTL